MQSAFGSVSPSLRIAALLGTQYQKAALRVVPPISGAFSSTMTSSPSQRENKAADNPPAPLPTTTTSTSASNALARAGAADLRLAVVTELDMSVSTLNALARSELVGRRVLPHRFAA